MIDAFVDQGTVDLIPAFCRQIPVRVIANILRIPESDAPRLYHWAQELLQLFGDPTISDEVRTQLGLGQVKFHEYLGRLIAERQDSSYGDEDFIMSLIRAGSNENEESRLSDLEALGTVATIIFGGSDTAAILMAHLVHSLLSDRNNWEELLANRGLINTAVEESMRQRPPARGPRRFTTREVTIAGVTIPVGQQVWAGIWAANHDETVFPDPDRFDMHRTNLGLHLGWGQGIHFCVGAPLARTEARIAIDCLLERLPSLRLVPGHKLEYQNSKVIPTLLSGLVVEW